ncbi:Coiled-coil domain-containing protein 97 [Acipenser ruthenus]|uniref:Coiled-coil domain-containing protein 97 n=1 Tax=Acipenser ruthenus TaxID=7906 RepID=A0A662YNC2_ACIRT|nr:Coiled-coil domain-containing protein 97 [Acipenser ruthenus]
MLFSIGSAHLAHIHGSEGSCWVELKGAGLDQLAPVDSLVRNFQNHLHPAWGVCVPDPSRSRSVFQTPRVLSLSSTPLTFSISVLDCASSANWGEIEPGATPPPARGSLEGSRMRFQAAGSGAGREGEESREDEVTCPGCTGSEVEAGGEPGLAASPGGGAQEQPATPLDSEAGGGARNLAGAALQAADGPCAQLLPSMLERIARSGAPVKSQQKGEPDLTLAQKQAVLGGLYQSKPLVFLERFRAQIRSEDLPCFQHLAGGYEAEFYCREIRRAGAAGKRSGLTRIRNKRYAALQKLIQGGEYFSEDCMRSRDPLLYEQCIGQYLTDEEVLERGSRAGSEPGSLADLLLSSYQEGLIQRRLERQQEREAGAEEEEDEDEEEEEGF